MRERAETLGGTTEVRTAPGQGTTVEVVLPPTGAVETGFAELGRDGE
jgi:nitrate/nitrite-specific signal transduction histidine kinase